MRYKYNVIYIYKIKRTLKEREATPSRVGLFVFNMTSLYFRIDRCHMHPATSKPRLYHCVEREVRHSHQ